MRIAFTTLGCKVNQYETETLMELFAGDGFEVVEPDEEADVYVVNSCTVTATSDQKTRQLLRKLKRKNPAAVVALTGCYPQAFPQAAESLPEADVITGSYRRRDLLAAVKEALASGDRVVRITEHERGEAFEPMSVRGMHGRTRAFLKIQDGCERYCSYCIIPTARGPVRSKPLADLQAELAVLAANGYREVVLTGINLSAYGKEFQLRLIDAVEAACQSGLERVRLGSLEPELLSDEDLARMAQLPAFCPQFHLSLQSGCDRTLKEMNRHYDGAEYRRIVAQIRKVFPNPSITTDVMVGFPGESDADFAESLQFVKEIGFAKVHVFAYSRREGTAAARRTDQIPKAVKEARSRAMIAATLQSQQEFLQSQLGQAAEILVETTHTPLGYEGFTKNYTPVYLPCSAECCGQVVRAVPTGISGDHALVLPEQIQLQETDFIRHPSKSPKWQLEEK